MTILKYLVVPTLFFLLISTQVFSHEENNENIQCFGNLIDFSGNFIIKDSILTCYRENILDVYSDTNKYGKRKSLEFIEVEKTNIQYLIKVK